MCEQIVKAGSLQGPIWGNIESVRLTEEPLQLKNPEINLSRTLHELGTYSLPS